MWWQLVLAGWLVSSEVEAQTGGVAGPRIERIDPGLVNSGLAGKEPIIAGFVGDIFFGRKPVHTGELRVRILDSVSDEAIPWASVRWGKGAAAQRMADPAGWISLSRKEVRKARQMEISVVGYATTLFDISDAGKDEYVRVLRLPRAADELPATTVRGYGTIRCGSVMGAVSTVKGAVSVGQRVERSSFLKDTLVALGLIKQPFGVYPNPVMRGASVTLSLKQPLPGNYMVQLFSTAGSLVESMRIEGVDGPRTELLNIPETAAAGLYLVRLQHEQTGKVYTRKVEVL